MTDQTIFAAALDIPDRDRRAAYVTRACAGDEALLRQVESLLAAHDKSGTFLDDPAVDQLGRQPNAATVTADATPPGPADDSLSYLKHPTRTGSLGRLAHYEVLEVLGRGGFGTVLRAFDERLHRVVAIKVLAPQLAASGSARARFEREARAGAAVRDEHVVNVYAVSEANEQVPYLVMEFVGGQTLQQKLDRHGPLSVPEILRIGSQAARGLAAAHATGLIHRDIKPSNILLENGVERVKITDFGLARAADDASISHTGMVAGTPMYMAPEQARGEKVDHRADLFSLGSVLYAMCTGRPPFRANTTMAVLKRVCEDDPRPAREINPEVPDWLAAVIAKLHAKDPAARFQSAKEVADVLAKYLSEWQSTGTVTAVSPPATPPTAAALRNPARRRRRVWAVALLAITLMAFPPLLYLYNHGFRNVSRYLAGHSDVHFPVWDRNVERVLVTHDGNPVATVEWGNDPLRLPPGRYDLQVVTRPGFRLGHVTVDTSGTGPTMTAGKGHRGGRFDLTLYRGDEFKVFVTAEPDPAAVAGERWVQLFNGRDLTGWQAHPEHPGPWIIENGILHGGGAASVLMGTGEFADFHLRCKVRVSDGGDGGIFFRADGEPPPRGHVGGFEAQINATAQNVPRTGSLQDPFANYQMGKDPLVPPNEWFTYEVIADGPRVQLKVNGQTTLDWTEKANVRRRGRFALQLADARTVVEFRSIEVRELAPDADALLIPEMDLSTYQKHIGNSFRVRVKGTTAGSVYGTDVYSLDSVLGVAAVHAGVLKVGQTGTIKITVLPGLAAYEGSTRNGVTSNAWNHHPASIRIDGVSDVTDAPAPAPGPQPAATGVFPDPGTVWTYQNQVGKTFAFDVIGSTVGPIWGTDVYTADSRLGTAAVHAGVLKPGQRGTVRVTILAGRDQYTGSTRNGVTTNDFGKYPGSFRIDGATNLSDPAEAVFAGSVSAFRGRVGHTFVAEVLGQTNQQCWGTDVYSDDSDVGTAAVHAGLVKAGEKGKVKVTVLGSQDRFTGSTRNGVTTESYRSWPGSFKLEMPASGKQ